ncbi:MAG TPA: DUF1289 domain-containing protein [Alphaproteobacteria bacterium]|nr:MAG: DUF1289 domain-containing protein [SAR116 cluster bacterium MED-G06]HCV88093.1 DUF1289 domain-containing protein [Alphaproteobacteria bacterium]
MSDETALPSPCISICQLDRDSGRCVGCYRTGAEIAAWRSMSPDAQRDLLEVLRDRRATATGIRRRPTRRRQG